MKQAIELMQKLEVNQIKKQIEILLTFMPDALLCVPMFKLNEVQTFVGVLLYADLSGLTQLTEKYVKTGKGGIYRLSSTLNAYIGAIVEAIHYFGGDVLQFSGDTCLALWRANPEVCLYEVIHQVIVCSLFIQNSLGFFETEVNVTLKLKLTISCGHLRISVVGEDQFKHYVVLGQPMNDVKAAGAVSVSGDVVVSAAAWGHLAEDSYDVTYAYDGNVKVLKCVYKPNQKEKQQMFAEKFREITTLCNKHIELRNSLHGIRKFTENVTESKCIDKFVSGLPPRKTFKIAVEQRTISELSPFIIKPVLDQVEDKEPLQFLTEMREVTIQIIKIVSSTFDEDRLIVLVGTAHTIICNVVSNAKGIVNKVSLSDKDATILVLLGLKGIKYELESQNALSSAYKIRKEIMNLPDIESVSIGITHGLVYCGVVGHPLRKEYTILGEPINKAAKLVCIFKNKITCDYETYSNSKLPSTYFQLQSSCRFRGIESAGHIFEYNEDFEEGLQLKGKSPVLIGRNEEVDFVEGVLHGVYSYSGVLFKGDDRSGKTRLLEYCFDQCIKKDYVVAFVALYGGVQRAYSSISLLYRQIFDQLSKLKGSGISLGSFKRNLWDMNEIIQEKLLSLNNEVTFRKKFILDTFVKICSMRFTVIFIDNVQYIDKKSFEIINETIKRGKLKLICSGTFEEKTWGTLWHFSLTEQIRIVDMEPLDSNCMGEFICQFLQVGGVSKTLCNLVDRCCKGSPGCIENCLMKLVKNSGIKKDFVFPEESLKDWLVIPKCEIFTNKTKYYIDSMMGRKQVLPIVTVSEETAQNFDVITPSAISLDLLESFTPFEKSMIKTAAVLGCTFTRIVLVIMLKHPNMEKFTNTIRHFFDTEVFECGSKYIRSGGRYTRLTACSCYVTNDDMEPEVINSKLPKYAFCKNLHFMNKSLRSVAYELIPVNERNAMHLQITEILEKQNNSCRNCLRDNYSSIFQFQKYSVITERSERKQEAGRHGFNFYGEYIPTNILRGIINDSVRNEDVQNTAEVVLPNRKVWDPSICFCLEILTRVYADLVYHSSQADHTSKTIFFLYQNGLILSALNELEDAVVVLKEASELCVSHIYEKTNVKTSFAQYLFIKICASLAQMYFSLNNWKAAKNYCMLTLRQFNIPMTFLYFSQRVTLLKLDKIFSNRKVLDQHSKDSIGKVLSIISRIFAAEGYWDLAVAIASSNLKLVKYSNPNIELLCDVYSTALDMHSYNGHTHICQQLARNLGQELIRFYGNNLTSEIFAVAKLMYIIFQIKAKSGVIWIATKMGFRLFELNRLLHAYIFQVEVIPILDFLLILQKRFEDVVFTAKCLKNMSKNYDKRGEVAYYAICLVMVVEANFYLETVDTIESFIDSYFRNNCEKLQLSPLEHTLIVFMNAFYVREGKLNKMKAWKCNFGTGRTFFDVFNYLKFNETSLILLSKDLESTANISPLIIQNLSQIFENCVKLTELWNIFLPRLFHYKAYMKKLMRKNRQAVDLLKQADVEAEKMGNILEKSWIMLSMNCWKGDFQFSEKREPVFWKMAYAYAPLQWSQIMFVLPVP